MSKTEAPPSASVQRAIAVSPRLGETAGDKALFPALVRGQVPDMLSGVSVPTGVTTVMMSSGSLGKAIGVTGAGVLVNVLARSQEPSKGYQATMAMGG